MTAVAAVMTLDEGLTGLQLDLLLNAREKLDAYVALLRKWNNVYNLTALHDPQDILTHHLLDSLALVPHVPNAGSLLDVGSGAGLPGIPLAIALPQLEVTLIDSNHKKTAFLQQAVIELALGNVEVICARVENIQLSQLFNVVTSRAFADLLTFVELAGRLVAPGGRLLAMKGALPEREMAQLDYTFQVIDKIALAVPGLNAERHLIVLQAV
jgi:16S rRNA (guanine527-N7)-methyltransferase